LQVVLGLVLIAASVLYTKNKTWVWIALIASIIALPTGGGYFIGAILGIIGAALALKGKDRKGK